MIVGEFKMSAKMTHEPVMLFGVNIQSTAADSDGEPVEDISTLNGGQCKVSSTEECLTVKQESGVDQVDTSLTLSSGSTSSHVSKTGDQYEKQRTFSWLALVRSDIAVPGSNYIMHGGPVLCPMPLRCFPPASFFLPLGHNASFHFSQKNPLQETNEKATPDSGVDDGVCNSRSRAKTPKRRGRDSGERAESVKRRKRSSIVSHKTAEPIPSIEQNPKLLRAIESEHGIPPVFVYRKRLQNSDIKKDQNRIFLTKCEELMKFLTDEERSTVNETKEGLEIRVVDPEANSYTLHMAVWGSMPILKSQWIKLVQRNNVLAGFWVEMWGYRCNEKIRLAVNFRRPAEEAAQAPNWISDRGNGAI